MRVPAPLLSPPPLREAPIDPQTNRFARSWSDYFVKMGAALRSDAISGLDPAGNNDSSAAINAAIQDTIGRRGAELVFPPGDYLIESPIVIPSTAPPLLFRGAGSGTRFIRNADMSIDQGVFDLQGSTDVIFRDFDVDGMVLTSEGISYSTIGGAPMHARLKKNSTFWLHGGCERIRFQGLTVRHTGGYLALLQCTQGLIRDVRFLDCLFENNRPHRFGVDLDDLNYGSWTGGIYVDGDGITPGDEKVLRGLLVQHCTFRRNTGNCLWSHLYGLNELHSDFRFIGNAFTDIGLDGILVGGVTGGAVEGNVFRRIGYTCASDTDRAYPRWLAGANATALDSAGIVKGVAYKGNTFISINGGCMDLDGHGVGAITGNICQLPVVGEPEYEEDQISITGPGNNGPQSYGLNLGNTNNQDLGARDLEISGNQFKQLPAGSIRLYSARDCQIVNNNIDVPDAPSAPPIVLGNIGLGENQRAHNNIVSGNRIRYNPASPQPAVYEDANGFPFENTDKNRVVGNTLWPSGTQATEFQKDGDSASTNS